MARAAKPPNAPRDAARKAAGKVAGKAGTTVGTKTGAKTGAVKGASTLSASEAPQHESSGSSTDRSLRLLATVAAAGRPSSLAELAAQLSLPKGTVHRLCGQLLASGHLARDIDDKCFMVGPALRRMALDALNRGSAQGLRHAVLADLVQAVGETCNFTTLDGAEVLYLDRVEARWPLRLMLDVGSRVPLHCTASGKLFLAHLPTAQREALLTGLVLPALTRNTLTDAHALRQSCERIAEHGYSTDNEEYIAGLVAVAVPVRDVAGAVRAAIALHAPTARMSLQQALGCLPAMRAAAQRIQALL